MHEEAPCGHPSCCCHPLLGMGEFCQCLNWNLQKCLSKCWTARWGRADATLMSLGRSWPYHWSAAAPIPFPLAEYFWIPNGKEKGGGIFGTQAQPCSIRGKKKVRWDTWYVTKINQQENKYCNCQILPAFLQKADYSGQISQGCAHGTVKGSQWNA